MELEDEADVTVAESGPGVAREQMERFALNQQVPGIRRFQCAQQVQERLADAKRVNELKKRNAELKKMLAESLLRNRVLEEVNS